MNLVGSCLLRRSRVGRGQNLSGLRVISTLFWRMHQSWGSTLSRMVNEMTWPDNNVFEDGRRMGNLTAQIKQNFGLRIVNPPVNPIPPEKP